MSSGASIRGTRLGISASFPSPKSKGIWPSISPCRRLCWCLRYACCGNLPSAFTRGLGWEGLPYDPSNMGITVNFWVLYSWLVGSSHPSLHGLCGLGGCRAHVRSWKSYWTGLQPWHATCCFKWKWGLPYCIPGCDRLKIMPCTHSNLEGDLEINTVAYKESIPLLLRPHICSLHHIKWDDHPDSWFCDLAQP